MKLGQEEKREWDYELFPVDGSDIGKIEFLKLNVKAGQIIKILFHTTGNKGYIYDARDIGLSYLSYQNTVLNEDAEKTLKVTKDGYITISGHHKLGQQNYQDCAIGKYIKIKIE